MLPKSLITTDREMTEPTVIQNRRLDFKKSMEASYGTAGQLLSPHKRQNSFAEGGTLSSKVM